jgi:predicted TIM-barrel fold metal-dependent hydrolase
MKQIKTSFSKFGDDFNLIKRDGDFAIFERTAKDSKPSYEVIEIQKCKKERLINGIKINDVGDEFYPSSEMFGTHGWNCTTIERALEKFEELINKVKKPV